MAGMGGSLQKRRAYLATGALGVALSAGYLLMAWRLPMGRIDQPGAGVFPIVVGVLLLLASLSVLREGMKLPPEAAVEVPARADRNRVLRLFGLILGYIVLLPWTGQLIGSLVFCLLLIRLLSATGWILAAIQATVISIALYCVFVLLLQVQMPSGILGI